MRSLLSRFRAVSVAAALVVAPTVAVTTAPVAAHASTTKTPARLKALAYAKKQLGDPYRFGAAGPNAFDCSGLTMAAWRQAGVSLPHSSSAQQGFGTPVSASNLRPGDLVFYYQPVSHVGMYIGNGMIVNAENPSAGVRVTGVFSMPFSGARHLG
jgi:peptidoglycan DL-endopeptidase CwlO